MDIFKVITENKSFRFEPKVYPEKGMSPKNSSNKKLNSQKDTFAELKKIHPFNSDLEHSQK